MNITPRIYMIVAAAIILAMLFASLWSVRHMAGIEREANEAKAAAEKSELAAIEAERRAAEYRKKIEYLEGTLSALGLIASEQDEQLKIFKSNTDNARLNVGRARAVERIESTTAELCSKLAELGHPCG